MLDEMTRKWIEHKIPGSSKLTSSGYHAKRHMSKGQSQEKVTALTVHSLINSYGVVCGQ